MDRPECNWPRCRKAPNPCFAWCKCRCHTVKPTTSELKNALRAWLGVPESLQAVDPPGCRCESCKNGSSVSMDRLNDLTMRALSMGALANRTQMEVWEVSVNFLRL